jgi:ApbE superfamily uncharacterized protein (UPF0280 family)
MRERAQVGFLPGRRGLHLHDGPIDLVVEAWGEPGEVHMAYRAASLRFVGVLDELCAELPVLRRPVLADSPGLRGVIARRMASAVAPYAKRTFITPMAAVAGAVAEEILEAMTSRARLAKAFVNDGGDIAVHLSPGEHLVIGMVQAPELPSLFGTAVLEAGQASRGIATSGWRGRSFSLGIADAVTVLADRASSADAAATLVANAVDLPGHPNVVRVPASSIAPDSDLGDRMVTQEVGELSREEVDRALHAGTVAAEEFRCEGLVLGVALHLRGETRIVGLAGESDRLAVSQEYGESRRWVHA